MMRILFLILILMTSVAFAQTDNQTPYDPLPEATKVDEFGKATNGNVKMRMDAFDRVLKNDPNATGYIITYGTPKEIARREKQIRDAIRFRGYDATRITFVSGGNRGNGEVVKTLLFLVPAGALPPKP